jgi:hypothetical protein
MYWDGKYPRLITKEQMKQHMDAGPSKFIGVADITSTCKAAWSSSTT